MKKYSNKFKRKVVAELMNGSSISDLNRKYGIGGDHTIKNWHTQFKNGLLNSNREHVRYTKEFKKKVLSEIKNPDMIYKVASKYGIQHITVSVWYDKYITKKQEISDVNVYDSEPDLDLVIDEVFQDKTKEYSVDDELKLKKIEKENNILKTKNKKLLDEIDNFREESKIKRQLESSYSPKVIKTTPSIIKGRESAIVLQWSDWHIEEVVKRHAVNDLNEFNLEIAERRINQLLNDSARIIDTIKEPYKSKKIIIHLGGDFITGNIHDELAESNSLLPTDAIIHVQNKLAGAIEFISDKTQLPIEIVTSSGNHGRMTKQQRISTELGNSLEQYMYHVLGDKFSNNKFIKFHQQYGIHTILDIYGTITRFHHGHFIRYGGGVGGPTIPINKAINNWNKSIRNVSLDVFGHFHQSLLGKSFIINGSLIGWNPYAISIKAEFEKPSQNLFVIDSLRGRTMYNPIILE